MRIRDLLIHTYSRNSTEIAFSEMARDLICKLTDYDAIERLRDRLHRSIGGEKIGGAAVLVGSGLSKNAEPTHFDAEKFPTWSDLARIVAQNLNEQWNVQHGTSEMLALFQMYEDGVGRAGLEELIQQNIPNTEYKPGIVHEKLLQLPWADVFTTNWDTLLERSAEAPAVRRRYTPVTLETDISRAPKPRIVKLHGGLPNVGDLIITEDDYRIYHERHSAFVDMVRMSLMQNAFCLIGFSSDDPNFIQWHGWVRDRLQRYANKPTLVLLNKPSRARRVYLERKGLAVVDLSPVVNEMKAFEETRDAFEAALIEFLNELAYEGPSGHAWPEIIPDPQDVSLEWDLEASPSEVAWEKFEVEILSHRLQQHDAVRNAREVLIELAAWLHPDADPETLSSQRALRLQECLALYPGWLILPHENLSTAYDFRWHEATRNIAFCLGRVLSDVAKHYPRVVWEADDANRIVAQNALHKLLGTVDQVFRMAGLIRTSLEDLNETGLLTAILELLETSVEDVVAAGVPPAAVAIEFRKIEKRCRKLALAIAPTMAACGRHDLLSRLIDNLPTLDLNFVKSRRRALSIAVASEVVGDDMLLDDQLEQLLESGAKPDRPYLSGTTGFSQSADPSNNIRAAALAFTAGDRKKCDVLVANAITDLHAIPHPNNEGLAIPNPSDEKDAGGRRRIRMRHAFQLRSREAWARFARLRYLAERNGSTSGENHGGDRSDHLFLERQSAYRCNAQQEYKSALTASGNATLRGEIGFAQTFARLVDDAGVPLSDGLKTVLEEVASVLVEKDPSHAVALALRVGRDTVALAKIGSEAFASVPEERGADADARLAALELSVRSLLLSLNSLVESEEVRSSGSRVLDKAVAAATMLSQAETPELATLLASTPADGLHGAVMGKIRRRVREVTQEPGAGSNLSLLLRLYRCCFDIPSLSRSTNLVSGILTLLAVLASKTDFSQVPRPLLIDVLSILPPPMTEQRASFVRRLVWKSGDPLAALVEHTELSKEGKAELRSRLNAAKKNAKSDDLIAGLVNKRLASL